MPTRQQIDPTNQAGTRRAANNDNNRRLNSAARKVLKMWREVPAPRRTDRKEIQNNVEFFVYDMTNSDLIAFAAALALVINTELETAGQNPKPRWYYSDYVERAFRSGTIQENAWLDVLFEGLVLAPLFGRSPAYVDNLNKEIAENYRFIKKLSGTTESQIMKVITDGISGGLSKTAIRRQIVERFEVSKSSSKRIVDTGVNEAYNNGRINEILTQRAAGLPVAVQHISALLTTTRDHHAVRHGISYTPEAQTKWWDQGSNRINCHCSVRSIKVTRSGQVVDKVAQAKVIQQGKDFFIDRD